MKKMLQGRGKIVAEFFLIVIGVLAALAADTAFENRRDNELKEEYLARLEADLNSDQISLTYRIDFFTDVQAFCGDLLEWLDSDAPVDTELLLASFYAAEVWPFLPDKSTYDDLKFTGNARLLDDIELRTSLSRYYNQADTSREGWNPSEDYREIIRGIVPTDIQAFIRQQCPTTFEMDTRPTGFPECKLPRTDFDEISQLFARLREDPALRETLTYRHSELGVMLFLLAQQRILGQQALDIVAAQ